MTETFPRCPICGGNAGQVPPGGHYLCQARKRLGQPTPSLGERCPDCKGSGTPRRAMPAGVALPMLPTGNEIRRWFPKCPTCEGKGYTLETADDV